MQGEIRITVLTEMVVLLKKYRATSFWARSEGMMPPRAEITDQLLKSRRKHIILDVPEVPITLAQAPVLPGKASMDLSVP